MLDQHSRPLPRAMRLSQNSHSREGRTSRREAKEERNQRKRQPRWFLIVVPRWDQQPTHVAWGGDAGKERTEENALRKTHSRIYQGE